MATPEQLAEQINEHARGLGRALRLRYTYATQDEIRATVALDESHLQTFGLVHGGVYASIVESLCSMGSWVAVHDREMIALGLENNTTFLRATSAGSLRCRARPLSRGARTQVWECEIEDDQTRLLARGQVRLLVVPADSVIAGQPLRKLEPE